MYEEFDKSEKRLNAALADAPIIAILRGLQYQEALPVVQALYDSGIRVAEIPLNSPTPFRTIALLLEQFGDRMVLGAGTVTDVVQVRRLAEIGAVLCVSPNTDPAVIAEAKRLGLVPVPGFQTVTEAFTALSAGARHLKLFPATGRIDELKAMMAVLPSTARVVAVGGVAPQDIAAMRAAGASAFGVGSDIYRPGASVDAVRERAQAWVNSCAAAGRGGKVSMICNPRAAIGEGPVWHPATERLTWVDPVQGKLFSADDAGGIAELPMEAAVFSLSVLGTNQLTGALANGLAVVDARTGQVERASTAPVDPGCRFNDMTVDPAGGLWVGAMHKGLLASRGSLYYAASVTAPCTKVADGLGVPNGMVFGRDGRTLYVVDTLARTLLAYPADLSDGTVGEPVIVTDFLGIPGKPDGLAIAPDGTLWVAMWGGGCIVRIGADGVLLNMIELPAPHVSSACFDMRGRLWVTTSRMRLSERQLAEAPLSGALFLVQF